MSNHEPIDIDICVDCLVWHANGDLDDSLTEADIEAITNPPGIDEGWDVVPGSSNDSDGFFTWHSCDACRRRLGGTRFPAAMIHCLPTPPQERIGAQS